jgi:hypothetical protein
MSTQFSVNRIPVSYTKFMTRKSRATGRAWVLARTDLNVNREPKQRK